ncbi:hypothetical protein Tco_0835991 [Tanacetum coccineum]
MDDQGKGKTKLMVFEKTKEAKQTQLKVKESKEAELKVKKEVVEVSIDEEDSRDLVFLVMKIGEEVDIGGVEIGEGGKGVVSKFGELGGELGGELLGDRGEDDMVETRLRLK